MVYLPVVAAAVVLALALGGRLGALAAIQLRAAWLFYVAIGLQLVAFPRAFFHFETDDRLASAIWLGSYACLLVAAVANLRLRGVWIVLAGMVSNLVAVVANGGVMPALPEAARGAGMAERSSTTACRTPIRTSPGSSTGGRLRTGSRSPTSSPSGTSFSRSAPSC